jgi:cystathionine beta-synthase
MYENLCDAIGNTPLVRVNINPEKSGALYAKLEYLNPGGSVKDRSAYHMITHAEKTGQLRPGGTLIDASSGNQGIATAMIGAMKGYKVIITVSEKVSQEKKKAIQAYGAEIVMCPATDFIDDPRSYHSVATQLHAQTPNSFMPNQYFNLENRRAHYLSLGPEIWKQTQGNITHFIAAAGTGGTVSGAGQFLKEQNPKVVVIAIDSDVSYRTTGGNPKPYKIEGMGVDFDSPVLNHTVIDEFVTVQDDEALTMLKYLSRTMGLLVGPSSGAVAAGAQKYLATLEQPYVAVMICGDSGRAYLSKDLY